jgi:hypothetical protein
MNELYKHHVGQFILVYLDDILIFSRTREEHLVHLDKALEILRKHKFYARLHKCKFLCEELEYLGHIVGHGGIKPDPRKVKIVEDWPVPKNLHERQFLGLANYFRKYMQGYSTVVAPLTSLTKKSNAWHWTPACQAAYEKVKALLTNAPLLVHPDPDKPYEVICDASLEGIGAVLLQDGRPIAYESRKLIPAERNYTTTEQELLAVVHALNVWRCYLEGAAGGFTVVTDHCPLTFLSTQQNLSRRQARWNEFLSRFNFRWEYRPGRNNPADPLSRQAVPECSAEEQCSHSVDNLAVLHMPSRDTSLHSGFLNQIRMGTTMDPWFQDKRAIEQHKLRLHNGVYWNGEQVVVPNVNGLREKIMREFHDNMAGGHFGEEKTGKQLRRHYWWPRCGTDIRAYCAQCQACQANKPRTIRLVPTPGKIQYPPFPWHTISMDFITGLPLTARRHDAILVVVDYFTKMAHFIPTTTTATAVKTAETFFDRICCLHGLPLKIISDRDSKFASDFWQALMDKWGTEAAMSTAFHPQTDGQTERLNRTLEQMLRMYISPDMRDWDKWLPPCEFAYNNAYHKSTGYSPFQLAYGRHPVVPASLVEPGCNETVLTAAQFIQRRDELRAQAAKALESAQTSDRLASDPPRQFGVGDMVWLSTKNLHKRGERCRKLLPKYVGPFTIAARVGKVAYRLDLPPEMRRLHPVFHVGLLAPHVPRPQGAVEDITVFDAVPDTFPDSGTAGAAPVPVDMEIHQILRHKDRRLEGQNVRDYLVSLRAGGATDERWIPGDALPTAVVAAYWTELTKRQLARTESGPPLLPPQRDQINPGHTPSGLDVLGLRHWDVPSPGGGGAGV